MSFNFIKEKFVNSNLYNDYLQAKKTHSDKHSQEIAALLGVSEAQLIHCRVGKDNVQRLVSKPIDILQDLTTIGKAIGITRKQYAVSIQTGAYNNPKFSNHGGLFLNPKALDLRMFFAQWSSVFALTEKMPEGTRHSIQFFDKYGDSLHKVFSTDNSDIAAWQAMIERYSTSENPPIEPKTISPFSEQKISEELASQLEQQWREMTNVHQFFGILKKHNLSRQQVFRVVSQELAWQVPTTALSELLSLAYHAKNEVMLFVGNRGCVQIFTGKINELSSLSVESSQTDWLNVSSTNFKLHIIENGISECWVTRKPTKDGFVTSLEVFDTQGNQIIQMYGQRIEGTPEQIEWSKQILSISRI